MNDKKHGPENGYVLVLKILGQFIRAFRRHGFKISKESSPILLPVPAFNRYDRDIYKLHWSGRNDERGVIVSLWLIGNKRYNYGRLIIYLATRDEYGEYHTADNPIIGRFEATSDTSNELYNRQARENKIARMLKRILSAKGDNLVRELAPLRFVRPPAGRRGGDGRRNGRLRRRKSVYSWCQIIGVVTLDEDRRLSDDLTAPGAECWFYVVGESAHPSGTEELHIIVTERDGELVYYPISGGRITGRLRGPSTGHKAFTRCDETLIRQAIKEYLADMVA